jgi:hypothetical protein
MRQMKKYVQKVSEIVESLCTLLRSAKSSTMSPDIFQSLPEAAWKGRSHKIYQQIRDS